MVRFPKPLQPGDLIAVTAPSSGVSGVALVRLDLALQHLCARGYRVVEGQCLRAQVQDASASSSARAAELGRFLIDPEIAAILPPWGGELASELLEQLDFEGLRGHKPKWLLGFSDISTLLLPLTLISGWATAHGSNLMELVPSQGDALTCGAMAVLEHDWRRPIVQHSSEKFQITHPDIGVFPAAPFNLTAKTQWRRLDGLLGPVELSGRLIGGCLDTLAWLVGSQYGDVPAFIADHAQEGVILYLENVEMSPPALVRALLSMRRQGWFAGLRGLLLGRNAAPDAAGSGRLGYLDALRNTLGDLPYPILLDTDIGHLPPQMTLVNGARARIRFEHGGGTVAQFFEAESEMVLAST